MFKMKIISIEFVIWNFVQNRSFLFEFGNSIEIL